MFLHEKELVQEHFETGVRKSNPKKKTQKNAAAFILGVHRQHRGEAEANRGAAAASRGSLGQCVVPRRLAQGSPPATMLLLDRIIRSGLQPMKFVIIEITNENDTLEANVCASDG